MNDYAVDPDFFFPPEFLTTASIVRQDNHGFQVEGIFDNEFARTPVGRAGIESTEPRFTCRTDDIPGVQGGDKITVKGAEYVVRDREDDGEGVTTLTLHTA